MAIADRPFLSLASDPVEKWRSVEPKWGPIGKEVFERTYARSDQSGKLETWYDTVFRVVNGNLGLVDKHHIEDDEREKLFDLIYNFKAIPAGRHLYVSGVPGRQFLFNCHRAGFTSMFSRHFEFMFNELMKGGGVGSNYSNEYIDQYPPLKNKVEVFCYIPPEYHDEDLEILKARNLVEKMGDHLIYPPTTGLAVYRVQDSREGWYGALHWLLEAYWKGHNREAHYDLSLLRPMGSWIKGFGGIASGPWALATLLRNIADFLNSKTGKKLTSEDIMHIDQLIAECVIAGNVRRSARMSIKYWRDFDIMSFIHCKSDPQKHWSTNISVEVDDHFWTLINNAVRADKWSEEALEAKRVLDAVIEGMMKNGEPGLVNTALASVGERGDIRSTNPCWTGDTKVWTIRGPKKIKDLVGKRIPVLTVLENGEMAFRMMRKIRKTRENAEILNVEIQDNKGVTSVLRLTPDHNLYVKQGWKVKAKDLKVGDRLSSVYRYPANSKGYLRLSNGFDSCMEHVVVASYEYGGRPKYPEFHVDHIDRNKTRNVPGNLRVMKAKDHNALKMLGENNPYHRMDDKWKRKFASHPGNRHAQGITFSHTEDAKRRIGEGVRQAAALRDNHVVVSISKGGREDVYNGVVDETHRYYVQTGPNDGILSANCGEIFLEDWENCNLGHINLGVFWNDREGAREAFRLMQRYLIRATFGDITDSAQRAVVDRNRRTGVGIFGFQAWLNKRGIKYSECYQEKHGIGAELTEFKKICYDTAAQYAHELGIPDPIKKTTLAPTGTISQMPGTSASGQSIMFKFGNRRVRYAANDRKIQELYAHGYTIEDDMYSPNTKVVIFPYKDILVQEVEDLGLNADEIVEDSTQIDMETTLRVQFMLQKFYVDNAIAFTINFPEGQYPQEEFARALRHWGPWLKGLTVMPTGTRPQAPYEPITRQQYEATGVGSVSQAEVECATGACPVR